MPLFLLTIATSFSSAAAMTEHAYPWTATRFCTWLFWHGLAGIAGLAATIWLLVVVGLSIYTSAAVRQRTTLLSPSYMTALFDPGRPLDARRYSLIFPDSGGDVQSSKPRGGLKANFPNYGYGDIVDLQQKLVTGTLGIEHLHAILGMSMAGMNAWQWAEAYPEAMDGMMPVVSLPIKVSGRKHLVTTDRGRRHPLRPRIEWWKMGS